MAAAEVIERPAALAPDETTAPAAAAAPAEHRPVRGRMSSEEALQAQLAGQRLVRESLSQGIRGIQQRARVREAARAAGRTDAAAPAALDTAGANTDNDTKTPTPAASPPAPAPAASATAPAAAPADTGEEAPAPAAAPPSSPVATAERPAPAAPSETPAASSSTAPTDSPTAPSAPARPAPLPEAFRSREIDALAQRAPTLKRNLARIWGRGDVDDAAKVLQMAQKVAEARVAPAAPTLDDQRAQLAREGRHEELAQLELNRDARAQEQQRLAAHLTELLADAFDVDPEDPAFTQAGETDDGDAAAGLRRLAEFAIRQSPLGRTALGATADAVRTDYEARLAQQAQQHADALAALRHEMEQRVKVAQESGLAQGRGGHTSPPRQAVTLPPEAEVQAPRYPTTADVRGLLSAGLRLRREAQ